MKRFMVLLGTGLSAALLVFAFSHRRRQRLDATHAKAFREVSGAMANCTTCHRLMGVRAGVRLIMHLQHDHRMDEDKAINTVSGLYKRILTGKKA